MIDILFEDNHLLVVNKPAGLPTQPNNIAKDSLEEQAKAWIKAKYGKPGAVFLHAVHRIDKVVSGIVVFARTSKALSRLQASMREHQIQKNYIAIVEGCPKNLVGTLEHFLIHDEFCARVVSQDIPEAKKSRLSYKVIQQYGRYSMLEIDLETGRYHQIRIQLSTIGCPIVGDIKYQALPCQWAQEGEIALHHYEMTFPHPTLSHPITIQAPLPQTSLWRFLQQQNTFSGH